MPDDERINGFSDGVAVMGLSAFSAAALLPQVYAAAVIGAVLVLLLSVPRSNKATRFTLWVARPLGKDVPAKPAEEQKAAQRLERNAEL